MNFNEFSEFSESGKNPKMVWLPMVLYRITQLATDTLPFVVTEYAFPSLPLARYLL